MAYLGGSASTSDGEESVKVTMPNPMGVFSLLADTWCVLTFEMLGDFSFH